MDDIAAVRLKDRLEKLLPNLPLRTQRMLENIISETSWYHGKGVQAGSVDTPDPEERGYAIELSDLHRIRNRAAQCIYREYPGDEPAEIMLQWAQVCATMAMCERMQRIADTVSIPSDDPNRD